MATFENFTVHVKPDTKDRASEGSFLVEVCVLKPADPNPDGNTRLSTNPWTLKTAAGQKIPAESSSRWSPAYPESSSRAVGDCATGWIDFPQATAGPADVVYENPLGDQASWKVSINPTSPTTTRTSIPPTAAATTRASRPPASATAAPLDDWDKDWAATVVEWTLADISRADEFVLDGRNAYLPMDDLADHMRRLQDLGAPPGVDAGQYYALCGALADRFDTAYSYLLPEDFDLINGAAAYSVGRQYTQELLGLLGPALGKSHTLPAWSFMDS